MGIVVAIKESQSSPLDHPSLALNEVIAAESDVIRRLQHENILRFYGCGEVFNRLFFVMEFLEKGSLDVVLRSSDEFLNFQIRSSMHACGL